MKLTPIPAHFFILFLLLIAFSNSSCVSKKAYNELLVQIEQMEVKVGVDFADSDQDGVPDVADIEPESPSPLVDTRGKSLDSDKDGILDYEDHEPFSPPAFEVNEKGVAQIELPEYFGKKEALKLIEEKKAEMERPAVSVQYVYIVQFPTMFYKRGSVRLEESEKLKLYEVAKVLQQNPQMSLVAKGFAHQTGNRCLDDKLSYQRAQVALDYLVAEMGISRERLVLNYSGSSGVNFADRKLNERVELTPASYENEMAPPNCN